MLAVRYERKDIDALKALVGVYEKEVWDTEMVLGRWGVDATSPVENLPHMDELIIGEKEGGNKDTFIVEVMGMPRSGKSTAISRLVEGSDGWEKRKMVVCEEGARNVPDPDDLKHSNPGHFFVKSMLWFVMKFPTVLGEIEKGAVVIEDRGLMDAVIFGRSHFLNGELSLEWLPALHNQYGDIEMRRGLVMCLVRPHISLEREGEREPGVVMNMDFLTLLYEQYVRFHWEVISGLVNCPAYICLNMECSHEEGIMKLQAAVEAMIEKMG